jgi:hypothetical protein
VCAWLSEWIFGGSNFYSKNEIISHGICSESFCKVELQRIYMLCKSVHFKSNFLCADYFNDIYTN